MEPSQRLLHVLGVESSCDDTGVAIVRQDGKILSNCVHSQLKQHISHGGIIPMMAKEYHLENIDRIANEAFHKSGLESIDKDIDAIAVTNRPGLNNSLQVGLNYARILAKKYSKPLIPIHHMHAHALMPLLHNRAIKFPYMALLISGGHCLLSICERYNKFSLLGSSHDEAPGDLLDKIARRLRLKNLGYPFNSLSGGAAIELLSQREGTDRFKYFNDETSVPLLSRASCEFSFTGYRGVFERIVPTIDHIWTNGTRDELLDELGHLCGSLQRVILLQLFKKLQRAMLYYRMHWRYKNVNAFNQKKTDDYHLGFAIRNHGDEDFDWLDVVVSGGVAANSYLINGLRDACLKDLDEEVRLFAPSKELCSDNGLMISWNGMLRYMDFINSRNSFHDYQLNDSVVFDSEQMDVVEAIAESDIGIDISESVQKADFKIERLSNPELKLHRKC